MNATPATLAPVGTVTVAEVLNVVVSAPNRTLHGVIFEQLAATERTCGEAVVLTKKSVNELVAVIGTTLLLPLPPPPEVIWVQTLAAAQTYRF